MTTVAKIFIVLNFLLSVFFVGVAATVLHKSDNFRTQLEAEKAEHATTKKDMQAQIDTINQQNVDLNRDRTSLKTEADNYKADLEQIKRERDGLQNDVREINGTKDRLSSTVSDMRTQLDELQKYVQGIEKEKDDSVGTMNAAMDQKRVAENEQQRLMDQLDEERAQVAALQANIGELQKQLDDWTLVSDFWAKERGVNLRESMVAAPAVSGFIRNVNSDLGFVILSVGKNDNVRIGHPFVISRGSEYIGDAIVDVVEDNVSSARIKYLKPGATVRVSDEVTTKL
jgi:peptidoglycan hydrolase CwlO-like protein